MNKKITIIEISSPGCHHCEKAKEILEEIKQEFPEVEVRYVDILSKEGQNLVQRYEIMSSPGIIVEGELFSVGGLDKNQLIEKIRSLL